MEVIGFFSFVLGTIIGSFLNVLALRYNTGTSLFDRSQCFSCGKQLNWYELVPLLSFALSHRRCRLCKSIISWQYPLVELLTGLTFLLIFMKFFEGVITLSFAGNFLLYALIFSVLIVIAVYDVRHKVIPDGFVYTFVALSLFSLFSSSYVFANALPSYLDILAAPLYFAPFFFLWFFSRGALMGLGDGKLALGIGWLLGIAGGFSAVLLAFWVGSLTGLALVLATKLSGNKKHLTMKSEIPFAPFLIIGVYMVFFFEIDVFSFLSVIF